MAQIKPKTCTVILDTTLFDLYTSNESSNAEFILVPLVSRLEDQLSANSSTTKFLYGDFGRASGIESLIDLRRTSCLERLRAQHFAFVAGRMTVVMFDPHVSAEYRDHEISDNQRQIRETFGVLGEKQLPQLRFMHSSEDLKSIKGENRLISCLPRDSLSGYTHLIDLEIHYDVLSNRALAASGLPTPKTDIQDFYALDCNGLMMTTEEEEKNRFKAEQYFNQLLEKLHTRTLPFVLKVQQTGGGIGSFMIHTDVERQNVVKLFSKTHLTNKLSKVNSSNAHLHPATLLLSDFIFSMSGTVALSFFSRKSGECLFISCTRQVMDSDNHWVGSYISYQEQARLQEKYGEIMNQMGSFLASRGYYGPVGADTLEDESGKLWIVDLNARIPGSLVLGLLRQHFSETRGCHEAYLMTLSLTHTREGFADIVGHHLNEGRIVVVAWVNDLESLVNSATLVLGGEDPHALEELVRAVRKLGVE